MISMGLKERLDSLEVTLEANLGRVSWNPCPVSPVHTSLGSTSTFLELLDLGFNSLPGFTSWQCEALSVLERTRNVQVDETYASGRNICERTKHMQSGRRSICRCSSSHVQDTAGFIRVSTIHQPPLLTLLSDISHRALCQDPSNLRHCVSINPPILRLIVLKAAAFLCESYIKAIDTIHAI
jgi:hypothetical protein